MSVGVVVVGVVVIWVKIRICVCLFVCVYAVEQREISSALIVWP